MVVWHYPIQTYQYFHVFDDYTTMCLVYVIEICSQNSLLMGTWEQVANLDKEYIQLLNFKARSYMSTE